MTNTAPSTTAIATPPKPDNAPRCPVVHGTSFNPMDPEQVLDPHPWLAAAREEAPVFYMPEYDEWYVTRYEDVLAVVRDSRTFSSRRVFEPVVSPELADAFPNGHPLAAGLINTDPPEHTRLRKLTSKAFSPRSFGAHEPAIRAYAHSLVDSFIDDGAVDFTQRYTRRLSGAAIAITAGAGDATGDDFVDFSDNVLRSTVDAPPVPEDEREVVAQSVRRFFIWLDELIEDRRNSPKDDFASLLVHATSDDGTPSLTNWEVVRILTNVLAAGVDTTSSLMSMMMYELLRQRGRWEHLRANPDLVTATVEEMTRLVHPVRGLRRHVLEDVELGGVLIPKGSTITVNYASAHRDSDVFENPDEFDPDRKDLSKHFGYGKGNHFCVGAALARMEAAITLEVLLERIPEIRLAEGAVPLVLPSRLAAVVVGLNLEWPTGV